MPTGVELFLILRLVCPLVESKPRNACCWVYIRMSVRRLGNPELETPTSFYPVKYSLGEGRKG
jgi:hypothetical protein